MWSVTRTSLIVALFLLESATVFAQVQLGGSWKAMPMEGFTSRRFGNMIAAGGKIYVIGGMDESNTNITVEAVDVFDPATQKWSQLTGSGLIPRWASSVSAKDGKLYIFGGFGTDIGDTTDSFLARLQILDPVTNICVTPAATGNPRKRHQIATAIVGDELYVFGGFGAIGTVDVCDLKTFQWDTLTNSSVIGRNWPTAMTIDNKIYIISGTDASFTMVDSIQTYEPATDTWNGISPQGDVGYCRSAVVHQSKIFLLNASIDIEYPSGIREFDLGSNTITNLYADPYDGIALFGAASTGETLYIMTSSQKGSRYFDTLYAFVPPGTAAVEGDAPKPRIDAYPNPTTSTVTVHGLPALSRVIVSNCVGTEVLSDRTNERGEAALDVSLLPKGMYLVSVIGQASRETALRFVKE